MIHSARKLLRQADSEIVPRTAIGDTDRIVKAAEVLDASAVYQRYRSRLPSSVRMRLSQKKVYEATIFTFPAVGLDREYPMPRDDCSEITWAIAAAMRDEGASPEEALAVTMASVFWKDRGARGKEEDPARFIEKVYAEASDLQHEEVTSYYPLAVDPADWAHLPVPDRQWLVDGLIPMSGVTGLYGDGGTGKTTLALQLAVAVALGQDWLGMPVRPGKVYMFLAENSTDDTHIALHWICRALGASLADLRDKMLIASRAGKDNTLMDFPTQKAAITDLFNQLLAEIKSLGPVLVILDTAADIFGGNEINRNEVRHFIAECCGRINRETGAAVILCAHPSREGIRSGEGASGSTAWNNTLRSRLYLRRNVDKDNIEADADVRVLEVKKANFATTGVSLDLRWKNGVFVIDQPTVGPQSQEDHMERLVAEAERAFANDDPWSPHAQSRRKYIVKWAMRELRLRKPAAIALVNNALDRRELVFFEFDRHGRRKGLCTPERAEEWKNRKK